MAGSYIERQMESAVEDMLNDKAVRFAKVISKLAAKQGGASVIENYQLLAKRALIVAGVAIVSVQAVTSIVNFVVSRRSEEQRIERVVRRVLEEEKQKAEAEA